MLETLFFLKESVSKVFVNKLINLISWHLVETEKLDEFGLLLKNIGRDRSLFTREL